MPAALAIVAQTPDAGTLAAWVSTVLALLVAWVGQRRLPLGVAEGLFVAAVNGLLLLNYSFQGAAGGTMFLPGPSLASLVVLWFLVTVWIERDRQPAAGSETAAAQRRAVRRDLAGHAATIAGLLTLPAALSAYEPAAAGGMLSVAALVVLLMAISTGFYVWRPAALSRYALVALPAFALVGALDRSPLVQYRSTVSTLLFGAAAAALAVVLLTAVADWRRRCRIWRIAPERLGDPSPTHRGLHGAVVAICTLAGLAGVFAARHAWTPLGILLAALSCLVVGHRRRSNAVGEVGLALVCASLWTGAAAWLPSSRANALLGMALSGVYMLWLARFWHQQLDQGRPWTTAGRLIPSARNLSYAAVGGEVVLAATWWLDGEGRAFAGCWQAWAAVALVLLHWWMLARDATGQGTCTGALAACLALLAGLLPLSTLAAGMTGRSSAAFWLSCATILLALAARRAELASQVGWVYNAYVAGLIPVAIALDLSLREAWSMDWTTVVVPAAGVFLAIALRFSLGPLPQSTKPRASA